MDAIALLKADHKTVEGLFQKYEAAGPRAYKAKGRLVEAAIEAQVFYPAEEESKVASSTKPGTSAPAPWAASDYWPLTVR